MIGDDGEFLTHQVKAASSNRVHDCQTLFFRHVIVFSMKTESAGPEIYGLSLSVFMLEQCESYYVPTSVSVDLIGNSEPEERENRRIYYCPLLCFK